MDGLRPLLDNSNVTETLKDVVAKRLAQLRRNAFEAARVGELERSYVNDILIEKKLSVRGDKLAGLARALDWSSGDLLAALNGVENPARDAGASSQARPKSRSGFTPEPQFLDRHDRLCVFAAAEGGAGEMVVDTDPIEVVPRPWFVKNVRDAYAVLIVGESMAPAYEPGHMAIVNPRLPAIRGEDAIFVRSEHDGDFTATIKRLVRSTDTAWVVQQFNPPAGQPAEFELPKDLWPKAYRVVGRYNRG
jgi:phage repressor protein C with HTH and peptisase S24 domain